jgi:hypothetical protein
MRATTLIKMIGVIGGRRHSGCGATARPGPPRYIYIYIYLYRYIYTYIYICCMQLYKCVCFPLAQAYVSSVRSLLHMAHSAFTVYGRRGISSSFGRHATLHSTLWSCIEDDEDHDQWSEGGIQQWKLMQHPKFLKLVSILGWRSRTNIKFCVICWHNCAVAATAERKRVQEAAAADDECAAPDVFWPDTDDGF